MHFAFTTQMLALCRLSGGSNIPDDVIINQSLALDIISLTLLAVAFYSQSATISVADSHWETRYKVTGQVRSGQLLGLLAPHK